MSRTSFLHIYGVLPAHICNFTYYRMPVAKTDRKVVTPEKVQKLKDGKFAVKTVQGYNTVK